MNSKNQNEVLESGLKQFACLIAKEYINSTRKKISLDALKKSHK